MIRVLHLRDTDRVCGPGKTIIETALATDTREFSQIVGVFLGREPSNPFIDSARRKGVEVIELRSASRVDPRLVSQLLRVIRDRRIDILHSHEYKSDILAYVASRFCSVSIMTTVHGWIRNQLKSRLYVSASQALMRQFDRVVAVSERTKDLVVASGIDPGRVVVIRNGIVTANYRPEAFARGAFRMRHGIPLDAPLIGYVGRLSPEKGQTDLVRATPAVAASFPDVRFVFVGDGPDRQRVEALATELGLAKRMIFTGHLDDVRPIYRDLDVLALTSHTEGLPNVVLEALCMGTPVLATDVGGTSEIIRDGETGLLVRPREPDAIAAGLVRLLAAPDWRGELVLHGGRFVREAFDFSRRVAREESLYRDIIASRRRPDRDAVAPAEAGRR